MEEEMPALPWLAEQYRLVGTAQSSTMMFSVAGTSGEPITIAAGVESDELVDKAYCPTPQGWLLVRDRRGTAPDTYLLDHRSRQRVQLPPLAGVAPDLLVDCHVRLSNKNPASPAGCLVLVVEPDATVIWYHHTGHHNDDDGDGSGSWIRYEYDIGIQGNEKYGFEKTVIFSIAAWGGKFYFNPEPATQIGVLEFLPGAAEPAFSTVTIPGPAAYSHTEGPVLDFLVESGDDDAELYLVRLLHHYAYREAAVYKMDFSTHQWLPADDLGGSAFFVSCNFGASCDVAEEYGIQKKCVYSVINRADKCLKMFSIGEGGWSTAELREMQEAYLFRSRHINIEEAVQAGLRAERTMLWVLPTDTKAAQAK